jgi:hypothetical protein
MISATYLLICRRTSLPWLRLQPAPFAHRYFETAMSKLLADCLPGHQSNFSGKPGIVAARVNR